MLKPGLYEQVVNRQIREELEEYQQSQKAEETVIDPAEAPQILSAYVSEVAEEGLRSLFEIEEDTQSQIALINRLIEQIADTADPDLKEKLVEKEAMLLTALTDRISAQGAQPMNGPKKGMMFVTPMITLMSSGYSILKISMPT